LEQSGERLDLKKRQPKALKTKLAQGGPPGLSPFRSDNSYDGQVEGWTLREAAKDAQGKVGNNSASSRNLN
jgi:hypothetical protein